MTIGDKIRSMTDAELAVFLDKVTSACASFSMNCEGCPLFRALPGFPKGACCEGALEAKLRLEWEEG